MSRHHHTPRHLDDPVKPVLGLSIPQFAGAVLALLCGLGAWSLLWTCSHDRLRFWEAASPHI